MTRALNSYRCYVCGAPAEDPPWGHDGRTPSFDICPCCGCEHGYEDSTLAGIERLRAAWLAAGGHWREPGFKPVIPNLSSEEITIRKNNQKGPLAPSLWQQRERLAMSR